MPEIMHLKYINKLRDEFQQIYFSVDGNYKTAEYERIDPIERHLQGKTRTHVFALEAGEYYQAFPEEEFPTEDVYFYLPNHEFYKAGLVTYFDEGELYLHNISSNVIYLDKGVMLGQVDVIETEDEFNDRYEELYDG